MNNNIMYYPEVENSAIKIMKIIFSYALGQFWLGGNHEGVCKDHCLDWNEFHDL